MEFALKGWRMCPCRSFLQDNLTQGKAPSIEELTVVITAAEGEGGEENLVAFLLGDFFGAIGEAAKREERKRLKEEEAAAKAAKKAEAAAAAAANVKPAKTEAELKAARDARYAARKQRKR